MNWNNMIVALVGGGFSAAIVKLAADWLAWRRERKARKEEQDNLKTEERLKVIEEKTDAQSEALRFILYDRIRSLALAYIAAGEIDFDERRILNDMHRSYHSGLDGNGDLDNLMGEVNKLPLTRKENL